MPSLFAATVKDIVGSAGVLSDAIKALPLKDRIEALNRTRELLHQVSPFADEPVDCVLWVPVDSVRGNDYNPNAVAPPEMRLLELSVREDGFTQPVVAHRLEEGFEVVDGFHRARVARESKAVRERLRGHLPLSVIQTKRAKREDRITATIRHNRARGEHGVRPMTEIVAELRHLGWDDESIGRCLGMDADEVLRFLQNTGLPELFSRHEYSRAWEGV